MSAGKVKRGDEGDAFGMGFKFPWQKKKDEKWNWPNLQVGYSNSRCDISKSWCSAWNALLPWLRRCKCTCSPIFYSEAMCVCEVICLQRWFYLLISVEKNFTVWSKKQPILCWLYMPCKLPLVFIVLWSIWTLWVVLMTTGLQWCYMQCEIDQIAPCGIYSMYYTNYM